jgi:hypothetical protein
MASFEIPLWVTVLGGFLAIAAIFLLAAWDIVLDWISDGLKGVSSKKRKS